MNKGLKILKWTLVGILFVFLFGSVTMLLWNWLVPQLFNGPVITLWQALGLLLLSKILLSGLGGKRWGGHRGMEWKHRYANRLASMTPEERERFKERIREKWCSRDWNSSKGSSSTSND